MNGAVPAYAVECFGPDGEYWLFGRWSRGGGLELLPGRMSSREEAELRAASLGLSFARQECASRLAGCPLGRIFALEGNLR